MSEHSHDNKPGELEESRLVVDNDFEVAPVNDQTVRVVRGASGSLRIRPASMSRATPNADEARFPQGRHRTGQGTRRHHHPLPGRQFRFRLSLGGSALVLEQERPRRLDSGLAFHRDQSSLACTRWPKWLEATGGNELMEAVNLGTRGPAGGPGPAGVRERARRHRAVGGRRRANGADQAVRYHACGAWATRWTARGRLGHKSAEDYGMLGRLRWPPACARSIRTWNWWSVAPPAHVHGRPSASGKQTVLEKTFDNVNFVSCHAYYHPELQAGRHPRHGQLPCLGRRYGRLHQRCRRRHRCNQGPAEEQARRVHLVR